MSDVKQQTISLEVARAIADSAVQLLEPACERIEIAGSVRRCKPKVGDIEIVAIPKMEQGDLFGNVSRSALDSHVDALVKSGWFLSGERCGSRFKQLRYLPEGPKIDLFVVMPPAQWGVIFTIRTGSAEFSKALVTRARRFRMRVAGGALYDLRDLPETERAAALAMKVDRFMRDMAYRVKPVDTPEEADFFEALGLAWVPPEGREIKERVK